MLECISGSMRGWALIHFATHTALDAKDFAFWLEVSVLQLPGMAAVSVRDAAVLIAGARVFV